MTAAALAPEFTDRLHWINAPPAMLGGQRGRVVAVAFWSAGSAYCRNLLGDLRHLQAKYPDRLRVFALHVPKFEAERDAALVERAVGRLGVTFPVANDPDFTAWQHYGIKAWPSVALIDACGQLREIVAGDMQRDALEASIAAMVDEPGVAPLADEVSLRNVGAPGALAWPAGLAVGGKRLYIADSGHHRILECSHDGRLLRQFGGGYPDLIDGALDEAAFNAPRGLALVGDTLYVADSGNHALRRIRLPRGQVDTLAGNGQPGPAVEGNVSDPAAVTLDQPRAVAADKDRLFVALAGGNQLWEYDLRLAAIRLLAGSGQLGLQDGEGVAAEFAHPAGLALVQKTLYVCDAAASALRSVNIGTGAVQTLVGQGLFDFGDVDGARERARLQHPLAIALDPDAPLLWVADAYNNALRRLKLGGGGVSRFDCDHALQRPAALAVAGGVLWVANTDAHEILRIRIDSGQATRLTVGE